MAGETGEETPTLEDACNSPGEKKWHWYNIENDLVEQGGLNEEKVNIDPLSFQGPHFEGSYKNNKFSVTYVPEKLLMVSSERDGKVHEELTDAFTQIVGYEPVAKYIEPSNRLTTTEWDKENPEGRIKDLKEEGKDDLVILDNEYEELNELGRML